VGVYFALSVLDFPFCFLTVRWVGAERIGHWEALVVDKFWELIPFDRPAKAELEELQVLGDAGQQEGSHMVEDESLEGASKSNEFKFSFN
jgi:hypothetical protein